MSQLAETIDNQRVKLAQIAMSLDEPNNRLRNQYGCLSQIKISKELQTLAKVKV